MATEKKRQPFFLIYDPLTEVRLGIVAVTSEELYKEWYGGELEFENRMQGLWSLGSLGC